MDFRWNVLDSVHLSRLQLQLSPQGTGFVRLTNTLGGSVLYALHAPAPSGAGNLQHEDELFERLVALTHALGGGAEALLTDLPPSWRLLHAKGTFSTFTGRSCAALEAARGVHRELKQRVSMPQVKYRFDSDREEVFLESPMKDAHLFRMRFTGDGLAELTVLPPRKIFSSLHGESERYRYPLQEPMPQDNESLLNALGRITNFRQSLVSVKAILGELEL